MRDYDDCDIYERIDDQEAWLNTIAHLGQLQIDLLFGQRATQTPQLEDRVFLPILEAMLEPFDEWWSPEQLEELWGCAAFKYHEERGENNAKMTFQQSDRRMRSFLQGQRRLAPETKPLEKRKQKRHR